MYAISFFTLLEQSLRLDGYEYMILARISALPHMKKTDQRDVINGFKDMYRGRKENSDVIEDRARLRKLLMGKSVIK